ncbi:MAG: hypothetical protein AAFN38_24560 [Cyanobacteria bacterium J06560_5]
MTAKTMPKRTTIRIPDTLVTDIERWAQARGQGFATVCALAVEMGVKQAKETGELPQPEAVVEKKKEKD